MAEDKKLRSVNTHFWNDTYVENLDPIEKLLFLYFLTNPLTNLAGIYEIPLRRIAFDTGIDKDMVSKIIDRFTRDNKVKYIQGYIILINFMKNQKYSNTMLINVTKTIESLPNSLKTQLSGILDIPYPYPIDGVSIPYREDEEEVEEEVEREEEVEVEEEGQSHKFILEFTEQNLSKNETNEIYKIWSTTWGRNPNLPELELFAEAVYKKFGYEKSKRIMKESALKGFRKLITLVESLDEKGNIREKGNGTKRSINENRESKLRAISEDIINDPDLK